MTLENTIAMLAAGAGVVATVIYILLGVRAVKTLSDIRDALRNSSG